MLVLSCVYMAFPDSHVINIKHQSPPRTHTHYTHHTHAFCRPMGAQLQQCGRHAGAAQHGRCLVLCSTPAGACVCVGVLTTAGVVEQSSGTEEGKGLLMLQSLQRTSSCLCAVVLLFPLCCLMLGVEGRRVGPQRGGEAACTAPAAFLQLHCCGAKKPFHNFVCPHYVLPSAVSSAVLCCLSPAVPCCSCAA